MHGSISSEMADFRNGREPIGMQPGQLKFDKKKMYFFVLEMYLCWICVPCGRQFQVFT